MGKNKLKRFTENLTFDRVYQPTHEEVFNQDYPLKGNWHQQVFKNDHPIVLELGCGRGEYTVALSKKYPDKNFIGIDIKGARLWRGAKTANEEGLQNAAFLRVRIEFILQCFAKDEVSEIWITFPDPQLKAHRAKKRLTSSRFLERYRAFLKADGLVHLKTDSRLLHEYTKALLQENELPILESYNDIYQQCTREELLGVRTHYEQQYLAKGLPITYLQFNINGSNPIQEPEQFEPELF